MSIKQSRITPYIWHVFGTSGGSTDMVSRFEVCFKSLDWVPNAENTRWFLVVRLEQPTNDCLNRLLRVSNLVLSSFGQPPLYAVSTPEVRAYPSGSRREGGYHGNRTVRNKDRLGGHDANVILKGASAGFSSQFHISIGWTLEKPSDEELGRARSADISDLSNQTIRFDAVKLKIGNAITVIPLAKSVDVGKGLIGYATEL